MRRWTGLGLWKIVGLAGLVGVAATGVVTARAERRRQSYTPEEIRSRLHERVAAAAEVPAAEVPAAEVPAAEVPAAEERESLVAGSPRRRSLRLTVPRWAARSAAPARSRCPSTRSRG